MAEYSKEKLYFLRLHKDFFNNHKITIVEKSKPYGIQSSYFFLKLMTESISHGGYLRCDKDIAYDNDMLASITDMDVDVVNFAMKLLKKLKLIEITKDGSIYIPMVEEITIYKTKGAVEKETQRKTKGGQKGKKCPLDNKDNKDSKDNVDNTNLSFPEESNNKKTNYVNYQKSEPNKDQAQEDLNYAIMMTEMEHEIIDEAWFEKNNFKIDYNEYLKEIKKRGLNKYEKRKH